MVFMAVVNYQTQCRHRHRRIKENFESSNVIYCCHKKAMVRMVTMVRVVRVVRVVATQGGCYGQSGHHGQEG